MPNKKAAEKFMVKSEKQRLQNKSLKSEIRTLAKKVEAEILLKSKETSMAALKLFEKKGMSSVSKGVFHINTIARKISRLYSKIKQINA
jgi:small subunit ribosomal protein S20